MTESYNYGLLANKLIEVVQKVRDVNLLKVVQLDLNQTNHFFL